VSAPADLDRLLDDLARAGVELAPHPTNPERLRFRPEDVPPDLAERMRLHKAALLAFLNRLDEGYTCPRCGGHRSRSMPTRTGDTWPICADCWPFAGPPANVGIEDNPAPRADPPPIDDAERTRAIAASIGRLDVPQDDPGHKAWRSWTIDLAGAIRRMDGVAGPEAMRRAIDEANECIAWLDEATGGNHDGK